MGNRNLFMRVEQRNVEVHVPAKKVSPGVGAMFSGSVMGSHGPISREARSNPPTLKTRNSDHIFEGKTGRWRDGDMPTAMLTKFGPVTTTIHSTTGLL